MKLRIGQAGEVNVLAIPLVLITLLLIGAVGFGYWAFAERQDYKNNAELKAQTAADMARKEESIAKDKQFAEIEKNPLVEYVGPEAFGSIRVNYPKTWSVYVHSTQRGAQPLDAYFNPRVVPSVSDTTATYALRIQVVNQRYATVVRTLESAVKTKQITTQPFALPKVPGVVGIRADGNISKSGKKLDGSMVVLPLRDKTIQIWTESPQFKADFNNIVLPNTTFVP